MLALSNSHFIHCFVTKCLDHPTVEFFIPSDRIFSRGQLYDIKYQVALQAIFNTTRNFLIPGVWDDPPTSYLVNSILVNQVDLPP